MKHSLFILSTLPFLASCSVWDNMVSRNITSSELPGVPTEINCNPEPTQIFSKAGDLIETVTPILHPSCKELSSIGAVKGETAGPWWTWFGPSTTRAAFLPTDSDYDHGTGYVNPNNVASDDPVPSPATPVAISTPSTPGDTPATPTGPSSPAGPSDPATPKEPIEQKEEPVHEPETEPEEDCDGRSHCEPDSKTDPKQYERWREAVERNKRSDKD